MGDTHLKSKSRLGHTKSTAHKCHLAYDALPELAHAVKRSHTSGILRGVVRFL